MSVLVIIGHGMATNRLLETLGDDHPFSSIEVFSDEHSAHYNRLMLSLLLAQETALDDMTPHDDRWYQARRIQCHFGCRVHRIETSKRTLYYQQQSEQQDSQQPIAQTYHTLIIATGATTVIPPEAYSFDNQMGFRQLSDVNRLSAIAQQQAHVTVIGGGLLGIEAAVGLTQQGAKVTLLHRNPVLMNRQLDSNASEILSKQLQQRGIQVRCGAQNMTLEPDSNQPNRIAAVSYQYRGHSTQHLTDLVVYAIGIRPNIPLAKHAGIPCATGVLVNQWMETAVKGIYALGECCEFEGNTYGLVAPIWQQVSVLAQQLQQGHGSNRFGYFAAQPYIEQDHLTKLKVSGINMHSMGCIDDQEDDLTFELHAEAYNLYRKIWIRDGRIQGALCVGDVSLSPWLFEQLIEKNDLSNMGYSVIFGPQKHVAIEDNLP